MDVVYWILGVIAFIIVLAVSIGLHEAGHMSVAKALKLSVPKFFVGFGPTLWSFKSSKTEYGLKAVPLGGFVMIEDDSVKDDKSAERQLLSHVSPWKRILVFIAGPAVNIVLGAAIIMAVLLAYPTQYVTNQISVVNECSADVKVCGAQVGGLKVGDTVIAVGGETVTDSSQISPALKGKSAVDITVERGGSEILLQNVEITDGVVGISLTIGERHVNVSEAFGALGTVVMKNVEGLAAMPSRVPVLLGNLVEVQEEDVPSSVVAVGKTYGDVSASSILSSGDKVQTLLVYSGMLNLGLGLINLLPIMPLDGGRIMLAVFDSIRMGFSRITFRKWAYKPISVSAISSMTAVTASIVFSFMALVIVSDVVQIFRGTL